ncbi:MAG: RNA-binding protein [Methanobacteriaceae archaeon]|jgi:DNA/RNA endonuclease YhcR with UshA esterase domain|nr:RNA-binding protein [Methanobacteriaceae archaeon]
MEITDDKIFKIALVTTLIGILGLIFFSGYIEPKVVKISEIDRSNIEEKVSITGVIESVEKSSSSNSYFLQINDGTGKLQVIIFESTIVELEELGTNPEIFLNQKVEISGTLTEYKNTMEIIVSNSKDITLFSNT